MSITKRIDNITRIPPDYLSETPPAPPSVKIELTARCDFQCFFCASGFKLRRKQDMDFNFFMRIVKQMREAGVEELGLFYLGESFLYTQLAEAIAYAKKEVGFPYLFLTTNGRMALPGKVKACMAAGLDSLKFSYNFGDIEQCKEVTGVDAFETIVENILAARRVRDEVEAETGHRCGLYASSILYDGAQLEKMKEAVALIEDAVDEHYWLPLYGQAGLTAGARGTTPVAGNIGRAANVRDPLPCWAVFTEGHITFDGKLSACCFDHDGRFDMGDLNEMSFAEAWHSEPFKALRRANIAKDVTGTACEQCIAYQDLAPDTPKPVNLSPSRS